jgi:hypothetical protein
MSGLERKSCGAGFGPCSFGGIEIEVCEGQSSGNYDRLVGQTDSLQQILKTRLGTERIELRIAIQPVHR